GSSIAIRYIPDRRHEISNGPISPPIRPRITGRPVASVIDTDRASERPVTNKRSPAGTGCSTIGTAGPFAIPVERQVVLPAMRVLVVRLSRKPPYAIGS